MLCLLLFMERLGQLDELDRLQGNFHVVTWWAIQHVESRAELMDFASRRQVQRVQRAAKKGLMLGDPPYARLGHRSPRGNRPRAKPLN